ncbi:MAG TPA: RNA polymerase sigma factor [bacterium]|nr:RNA polymerase sigma factor [bacterium]
MSISGGRAVIEESDLIRHILSGNRDLYAELVDRHGTYLYQLCLALLRDPHQAEEAAQEVLIKAYRSLSNFKGHSSFRTWVVRIGLNHCKDILRKRKNRRFLSLETLLEQGWPLSDERSSEEGPRELPRVTAAMLEVLTEGEKDVLRLVEEKYDMSYEEMGRRLGLSLDGVKGRLKRARIKLRRFLKGPADDEGGM